MILDKQTEFSSAQAVTASAASDNVIKTGSVKIGVGEPLSILAQVVTAFTDGGSDSTVTVTLQTDNDEAFGSPTTLATLGVFAALSAIGTRLVVPINPTWAFENYTRLYYTVANGNLTTGAITAGIAKDVQLESVYPSGFTVL